MGLARTVVQLCKLPGAAANVTIQTDDFAPAPAPARQVLSASTASPNEEAVERALRPKLLDDYVGQAKIREQLEILSLIHISEPTRPY